MDDQLILTSVRNPWIKQLRQLQRKKGRREQGCFEVEGTHALREAIATQWPLSAICFTAEWLENSGKLLERVAADVRQQLVGPEVLAAIASTQNPDGVVTICRQQEPPRRQQFPSLGLAVATLQDPGNLGTLIRSAAAVGCDGIWLSEDSVDPENPKVLRASAGQWFRQPPRHHRPAHLAGCLPAEGRAGACSGSGHLRYSSSHSVGGGFDGTHPVFVGERRGWVTFRVTIASGWVGLHPHGKGGGIVECWGGWVAATVRSNQAKAGRLSPSD